MGKRLVIDIESNGLIKDMVDYSSFPYKLNSFARLWSVVIKDLDTDEDFVAENEEITREWFETVLEDCEELIAHNGLKFDFPVLFLFGLMDYEISASKSTLYGKNCKFTDTLTLSRLYNPDRYDGHSLDSWGKRVGSHKTDFRQLCIDKGYIDKGSKKGSEFLQYCPEMTEYCIQDTVVTKKVFFYLEREAGSHDWSEAIKQETVLAHLAVARENLGFWFDKPAAIKCVEDLTEKMNTIENAINPILPKRRMNKGEIGAYIPPKVQLKKDGSPSSAMENFTKSLGAVIEKVGTEYVFMYNEDAFILPMPQVPLKETVEADITNLDHVKMYLISLGWQPSEWRERDLTKDAKKQSLPYSKRIAALERWYEETMDGKYKEERIAYLGMDRYEILDILSEKLKDDFPVRVPTSPVVRVGIEKELCPNLLSLGEKVAFAKDFGLFLTYKHRKSTIAGGDIEDMDFDLEEPSSGFLSMYREEDGRVPTPAIEIGAATFRYRHIGIANVARASSIYGKELRSLFGCGPGFYQFGFDFSSLENRIQGHYVYKYKEGVQLAKTLIAEKPYDLHTINAEKLGISRTDAKSVTYALLYGAQANKISKMLAISLPEAKTLVINFWNSVPALKELKEKVEAFWESTGKKYLISIDGRKVLTRSKHSLLNALFQSAGVISAKYTAIYMFDEFEKMGYCINPFKGKPDIGEMISYHDEIQLLINPNLVQFKVFNTEDEAKEFVSNYKDGQLSTIAYGKKIYVVLPNVVSKTIENSIKKASEKLKLNVPLGFEWIVGKNWYGTH